MSKKLIIIIIILILTICGIFWYLNLNKITSLNVNTQLNTQINATSSSNKIAPKTCSVPGNSTILAKDIFYNLHYNFSDYGLVIGEQPGIVLSKDSTFSKKSRGYGTFQEALNNVSGLKCLEVLDIEWVDETDKDTYDLSPISGLINLKNLKIVESPISDISPLKNMTELLYLDLSGTKVSDLATLKNFKKLRVLNLPYNKNVQYDFDIFKDMKNLELLSAYKENIPEELCQKIKQIAPKLRDCYADLRD